MTPQQEIWRLVQQLGKQLSDINSTPGLNPTTKKVWIQAAEDTASRIKTLGASLHQLKGAIPLGHESAVASASVSRQIRESIKRTFGGPAGSGKLSSRTYRTLYQGAIRETGAKMPRRMAHSILGVPSESELVETLVSQLGEATYKHGGAMSSLTSKGSIVFRPSIIKKTAKVTNRPRLFGPAALYHEMGEDLSARIGLTWRSPADRTALGHASRQPVLAEYRAASALGYRQGGTAQARRDLAQTIVQRVRGTRHQVAATRTHAQAGAEIETLSRRILRRLNPELHEQLWPNYGSTVVNPQRAREVLNQLEQQIQGPVAGKVPSNLWPEDQISYGRVRGQKGWAVHRWRVGPGGNIEHGEALGGQMYRTRATARVARGKALAAIAAQQQRGPIPSAPSGAAASREMPDDVREALRGPRSTQRPRRSRRGTTPTPTPGPTPTPSVPGYSSQPSEMPDDVREMLSGGRSTGGRAGARGGARAKGALAAENQAAKEAGAAGEAAGGLWARTERLWNRLPRWGKYAAGGIGALLGLRIIASHLGSNEPQDYPHDSQMPPEMRARMGMQGMGGSGPPLPPQPNVEPGIHEHAYRRPYVPFSPPTARVTSSLARSPRTHIVATDTQERRLDGLGAYLSSQMSGTMDRSAVSMVANQIGGHSERLDLLRDREQRSENRLYA